jgi:hypothetical protein
MRSTILIYKKADNPWEATGFTTTVARGAATGYLTSASKKTGVEYHKTPATQYSNRLAEYRLVN